MISADMRLYNYFTIGAADSYGQPQMPAADAEPEGTIKMAINASSLTIQDNIKYKDFDYIGLTRAEVKDTYIIDYNGERLKVLYVNAFGRLKQVFMKAI